MTNTKDKAGSYPGVSTLERAKFGPGMLLKHDDLEQLNLYTRDLSRLMFRSFFGCGVVCGLVVSAEEDCNKLKVTVGSGLALACSGDPVYVPTSQPFFTDDKLADEKTFWVVLCATKKCCAPRVSSCSSDDDDATSACTREKDGYEIRILRNKPECGCGCLETTGDPVPAPVGVVGGQPATKDCKCASSDLPCYKKHYDGICECDCGKCSGCDCECIVLAKLFKEDQGWKADHRWRRFIRPVLMRDPHFELERPKLKETDHDDGSAGAGKPAGRSTRSRTGLRDKT